MKKRTKPYTNTELFNIIMENLNNKGLTPNILDYSIPYSKVVELLSYQFDIYPLVTFGSCEGIYLTVYGKGYFGNEITEIRFGTIKTLNTDKEALYLMSKLQADIIWEARNFINDNIDDFEWD